MELLFKYQTELLALIAIVLVILIYLLTRKKSTQANDTDKNIKQEIPQEESIEKEKEEKYEAPKDISKEEEKEELEEKLLEGREEGDFGLSAESETAQSSEKKNSFHKRDVPPHEKITKDDFKEFAGERILLAEDNIINQKVIMGLLAESGIEVVVADDGVECLNILEKDSNFTIILMDAHMPRKDGFEATREIRANPNYDHIVVVALSGDTAADDIRKMSEAGMSEHLEKPLKMDALYDILYAYSGNKEKESQYNEIDIEEGMEISGYDENFYHEILNEFLNTYKNAPQQIAEAVQQKDLQKADQLLLDIIGVSANIGATKLTKSSMELKTALKEAKKEDIRRYFREFKQHLGSLTQEIEEYLS